MREEAETWDEVGEGEGEPGEEFQKARKEQKSELDKGEKELKRIREELEERRKDNEHKLKNMVKSSMDDTAEKVEDVEDDLGRIIPSELVTLSNPVLGIDFRKRFIEGKLLQYSLKEEKGRGPLVICLDGSSSMEGKKELWSKGVCLTLLEIAKRERRKFCIIVFSSGGAPLRMFESAAGEGGAGWGMKQKDIFELAEYFPGGGTNFEEPLGKALEVLGESRFRRGDIVFITDGEAGVGDSWLAEFEREKEKLGFKVYSVLIDLSERESWQTLTTFSDKVTSVSKLTSKEAKGLFLDL